ncbi:MAG: T9SS type A sorting domain-containing protein [Paludibacter sp.]|nr:T9SS type A sorting domain-containing protein [Paludibacter sp.]
MKKIILLFALVVFTTSSLFAITHGSIIKKNAPLDVVIGSFDGHVFPAGAVVDFKAVTIGGKIWAKVVGTGYELFTNPWSSQVRIYYAPTSTKPFEISQNNAAGYVTVDRATNTTLVNGYYNKYTYDRISVCQDELNAFNATQIWQFYANTPNSGLTGDTQKPLLTSVQLGSQDGTTMPVSCTASDNSGDYFYLISDETNGFYYASLTDDFTITGLDPAISYTLSVVAVDFSGNESVGVTTDINSQENNKISLSQNENSIVINSPEQIRVAELYSINGQQIRSQFSSNTLVTSDLSKGVYVLKVQDIQGGINKFKVIIR